MCNAYSCCACFVLRCRGFVAEWRSLVALEGVGGAEGAGLRAEEKGLWVEGEGLFEAAFKVGGAHVSALQRAANVLLEQSAIRL